MGGHPSWGPGLGYRISDAAENHGTWYNFPEGLLTLEVYAVNPLLPLCRVSGDMLAMPVWVQVISVIIGKIFLL